MGRDPRSFRSQTRSAGRSAQEVSSLVRVLKQDGRILRQEGNTLIIAGPEGLKVAELVPYDDVRAARKAYRGRFHGDAELRARRKTAAFKHMNAILEEWRRMVRQP